jgi:hypothetical protein
MSITIDDYGKKYNFDKNNKTFKLLFLYKENSGIDYENISKNYITKINQNLNNSSIVNFNFEISGYLPVNVTEINDTTTTWGLTSARKKEDYIKRIKEKEKQEKYDSVTSDTIEYSNVEFKRIKPFELISEVSWGIEEDQWLNSATLSPVFGRDDETRIERVSIKDIKKIFIGVEKGLIDEIEMPTNGGTFSYKNCEIVTDQVLDCSDVKSMLNVYIVNNNIEIIHRNNESGAFVAKLIDNKGYNFDVTNNGLYNVH